MIDSAGWNVDTLKEYMDAQFLAQRDALNAVVLSQQQQFRAQEAAISVASTSTALALTEAKVGPQKQYDVLTAKMDELVSRAGGSVPRGEMEALLTSVGQRAETQIADAVTSMTRQFSSDIGQVTKAVEAQAKAIQGLVDSVNELNTIQVARQGRTVGLSATGRAIAAAIAAVVGVIAIGSFIFAIWPKK